MRSLTRWLETVVAVDASRLLGVCVGPLRGKGRRGAMKVDGGGYNPDPGGGDIG
jgi:hypothetical protein